MIGRTRPKGNPEMVANMQFRLAGDPPRRRWAQGRSAMLILASFAGLAALFAAAG